MKIDFIIVYKFQIFAQVIVAQPFQACSSLFLPIQHYNRIGLVRRGDCMFIEKARQLEKVRAVGGIVIDYNTSLQSSNGAIFSMTGDGNNNVRIPLVLMFKDEAFKLLHLLSEQPNLIVYIGEEKRLEQSFYEQLDVLESFFSPYNQKTSRWIYGERQSANRLRTCSIVSRKLKQLESLLRTKNLSSSVDNAQESIQLQHIIDSG